MKTTTLLLACAALVVCNAAFADPIGYTETFNSGSNMDWGTDYASSSWSQLFSSNYDEDGAGYSSTGGVTGGYVYRAAGRTWLAAIFADSDASNGSLAGNVDYSAQLSLEAYIKWDGTGGCSAPLFFASTLDDTINPVGAPNLTLFYGPVFSASSSWQQRTADLTSSSGWYRALGSGDWASAKADVDVVGVLYAASGTGTLMVDDFVGTPEPGLLLTMAPMAGFLGWRLRRRSKRTAKV